MVTTAGKETEQAQCREAGCDDILLKPIHRRAFIEVVQKYLKMEERVGERLPVRMQVIYGNKELFTGFSVNLSTGGLFLETDNPLPAEESLSLEFHAPNQSQPISCRGSVAWVNTAGSPCCANLPPGMGSKFVDLDLGQMRQIRELLQASSQA